MHNDGDDDEGDNVSYCGHFIGHHIIPSFCRTQDWCAGLRRQILSFQFTAQSTLTD